MSSSPEGKIGEPPPALADVDLDFVMSRINKLEMDNVVLRRDLANAQDTLRREKDAMEVLIEAAQRLRVQNEELQSTPSRDTDTVAFLEEQLSEKDDLIRIMLEAKQGAASSDPEEAASERERELLLQIEAAGELLDSSKRRESALKEQLRAEQAAGVSRESIGLEKTQEIVEASKQREGELSSQISRLEAELQAARRENQSQHQEVAKLSEMLSAAHELGSARVSAAATSAESEVTLLQAQASAREAEIERLQGIAREQDETIQDLLSESPEHEAAVEEAAEKELRHIRVQLEQQQKEYSEMDCMWEKRLREQATEFREREEILEVPSAPNHCPDRRALTDFTACPLSQDELDQTLKIAESNKEEFASEVARLNTFIEGAKQEWEREWQAAFYLWKPGIFPAAEPEVQEQEDPTTCLPELNLQQAMLHIEHGIAARDDELIFLVEALRSTDIDRKELPPLLPVWRSLVQLVDRCRLDVEGLRRRLAEKDGECSDLKAELQQLAATQGERKVQGEESNETPHEGSQRQPRAREGVRWKRDAALPGGGAAGLLGIV